MKVTAPVVAVAALAAGAAVEAAPNAFSFNYNAWTFFLPSKCPSASGKPWQHGTIPGWCAGPKGWGGLPPLGGGDKDFCKDFFWAWTPFCKSGNPPCPKPPVTNPSGPNCVGDGFEQTQTNVSDAVFDCGIIS